MTVESDEQLVVPTLHTLYISPSTHTIITRSYPSNVDPKSSTASVRQELIQWLAEEALGGDAEAAEWTLLSCLSRV